MVVKDLLQKSDVELVTMLTHIDNEPLHWTPVILSELSRRSVVRLLDSSERIATSSHRLERLSGWLIVLTVVLLVVALPPAIEAVPNLFKMLGTH